MTTAAIGTTLGAAQLAATLSGVPFASGGILAFQLINATCSEVAVHKQKTEQLVARCASLLVSINDHAPLLIGMDASAAFAEAELVLASVHNRVQKWVHCGKIKRFLKSAQIGRDLDKCKADVDHVMERLNIASPVAILRMQKQSTDMMQHHHATVTEALQKLNSRGIELAVQRHNSGGNDAYELMRMGQECLVGLHEGAPVTFSTILSDGRQIDQSPLSSRPPSPSATVRGQLERALLTLHRLANIPPTILILDNQVKRIDSPSVRGGPYSHVVEGRWLGEKKVALKTIRILDAHDPKAQRLQTRFEHEITVWSKLKHENVLTMLGIVTNMGPIHIVSPWQLDNVRNYRYDNPDVNPLKLLSQAAKGLEYIHDQQVVHGNLKCTNMLVSEEGIVSLSDFGLTQVLTQVTGKPVSLTTTVAVRWHAPELLEDDDAAPTMASDMFAFGMSVLELLVMKNPYAHLKRDVTVIQDVSKGVLPPRPEVPEAVPWMSDTLWDTLHKCWKWKPEERMSARELSSFLEHASEDDVDIYAFDVV